MEPIELPAYVSHVPKTDAFDLLHNSIIIEDEGSEFLMGKDAQFLKPDAGRQMGGALSDRHYRRLVKALTAKVLGAGEFKVKPVLSAAHHLIDRFRSKPGEYKLSEDAKTQLKEALKEIRFKTGRTDSDWQSCKVTIHDPRVLFEYQAVFKTLPKSVKNAAIWQFGVGDCQQCLIIDGKPVLDASCNYEGLISAVRIFASKIRVSVPEAFDAWESEKINRGLSGEAISVRASKIEALRHWLSSTLAALTPRFKPFENKFSTIIASGGPIKDPTFWEVLKDELGSSDLSLMKINELPDEHRTELMSDPSFTVVQGLLTEGELALDAGNGRLKGGYKH